MSTKTDTEWRWPYGEISKEKAKTYDESVGEINKTLFNIVLQQCHKLGMHEYNVITSDTYFIFTGAPYSRCSFSLTKVLPGWKFGVWIEGQLLVKTLTQGQNVDPTTPVITFFCQHTTLIDKFKPSCSPVCVKIPLYEIRNLLYPTDPPTISPMIDMEKIAFEIPIHRLLLAIKNHPILVYTDSVNPEYPPTNNLTKQTIKWLSEWAYERVHDDIVLRIETQRTNRCVRKIKKVNGIENVYVDACEVGKPIHMWPPINVNIIFNEDIDIDDALDEVERIFKTSSHGKLAHMSEVTNVLVYCGKDDKRGWYSF